MTFAAFRQSAWYHYSLRALEQTQLSRAVAVSGQRFRAHGLPRPGVQSRCDMTFRLRLISGWRAPHSAEGCGAIAASAAGRNEPLRAIAGMAGIHF